MADFVEVAMTTCSGHPMYYDLLKSPPYLQ